MDKRPWREVFACTYTYSWTVNYGKSNALDLCGYRVRSYLAKSDAYVRTRYVINCYVGKNDIMQEILFKNSKKSDDFAPISPDVFHKLFSKVDYLDFKDRWGYNYEWWNPKHVEFVELENRILFKFKKEDWRKFVWGVNLDIIDSTLAGQILRKFGFALTFACRYPSTIKNLDDAGHAWDVISNLSTLSYKRNGYYEREIDELRMMMKEKLKQIEDYNAQFDQTCNGAADALNALSEKFGIVVNV